MRIGAAEYVLQQSKITLSNAPASHLVLELGIVLLHKGKSCQVANPDSSLDITTNKFIDRTQTEMSYMVLSRKPCDLNQEAV